MGQLLPGKGLFIPRDYGFLFNNNILENIQNFFESQYFSYLRPLLHSPSLPSPSTPCPWPTSPRPPGPIYLSPKHPSHLSPNPLSHSTTPPSPVPSTSSIVFAS